MFHGKLDTEERFIMANFKEVKVVDNFYQNSLFFPMPTVAISTLDEEGRTTIGAYSLVFPYYIAGKGTYAMLLECRNSSNTAQNILRTGKCALNFIKDDKKSFKELVRLDFPGKTPQEKMKDCTFELIKGKADGERPLILKDAYQVIECTWMEELENGFEISCVLAGKLRMNYIKLITGDKVKVEMSPYDLTKGRISYRYK